MGFGFLFVGYLLTFNVAYSEFTDVFALALMLLGLSTLANYAKGFRRAFFFGIPAVVFHLVLFGERIGVLLGFFTEVLAFTTYTAPISALFKAILVFFILEGVSQIAAETDIPVLRMRALRNRIFTVIYLLFEIAMTTTGIFGKVSVFLMWLSLIYFLYCLVYTFLNAKLFFECYVWICLEGDEDMARAPSRFAFINRFHAWEDKQDEKTMARKEEAARRRAERKRQNKK